MDCLVHKAETLIAQEAVSEEKRRKRIAERRDEGKAELELFEAEIAVKRKEIDDSIKAKQDELIEYYINLEKSLRMDVYKNTRSETL